MSKNKDIGIELMRIVAIFFVIFNHTREMGFFLFSHYEPTSLRYWLYLFFSIFCKFSVPLFFMISGALYLNREINNYRTFLFKRIKKILLSLILFTAIYYLRVNENISILNYFYRLYRSEHYYIFWFLYVYLSFLIVLPLLQKFAQSLKNKDYYYLFALFILFYVLLPCIEYLLWHGRNHFISWSFNFDWLFNQTVLFPLAGYFLYHRLKLNITHKKISALWLLNIATLLFSAYLTYLKAKNEGVCNEDNSQAFHTTFVLINATTIFLTCRHLSNYISRPPLKKIIITLSSTTLGVYLLHAYLSDLTRLGVFEEYFFINNYPLPLLTTFSFCLLIYFLSFLITLILRKIPIIKEFI